MLSLVTQYHIHYHLHPFNFILFKFKDLVAKKHPTNTHTHTHTHIPFHQVLGSDQNWMEVAYGTQAGSVRVVVRHPENIGQAPQIYQSYNVHTCPILRVVLGEKHLISGEHVASCPFTRARRVWCSEQLSFNWDQSQI